tara:strand:+ start:480 stop:917 length:438 start_codon:yes stop_codon:yes gene_type:complete
MNNQSGISMIESLIAAAIIGIGFVAIYSLSITSTNILMSSIDREKGNMIANTVFEDLITDSNNLISYNNMNFNTISTGKDAHHLKKTKWAQTAYKRLGSPQPNDKRDIKVVKKTVAGKDIFVVTIDLATRGGKAKNQFKRVFNAP